MTNAVAIIPARGGSKRIPGKNIRDFAGRPAIAWPLATAAESHLFAQVVVSTDSDQIARVARDHGAETPFTRDAKLSDDHAGTTEVIRDACQRLGLPDDTPVCCIYPTALFITPADLTAGLDKLRRGARWVLTASEYTTPIDRAYRLDDETLVPRQPEMMPKRSQDLQPAYFDAGQFYWATAATWRDETARIWDGAMPVILPADRAVDIDTEADWQQAERLYALMQNET